MIISRGFTLILILTLVAVTIPKELRAQGSTAIAAVIKETFASNKADTGIENIDMHYSDIRAYYESRYYKPVWTRDTGPKSKGKALYEELNRSFIHGLSAKHYDVEEIAPLMGSLETSDLAQLDLLLSGAFIEFADNLLNGRIRPRVEPSQNQVEPIIIDPDEIISGAADAGNLRNFASDLLKADDRYFRLIAKYAEYERIIEAGYWPKIAGNTGVIKTGDKDPAMVGIRQLLGLTGDLPGSLMVGGDVHDSDTFEAVKAYQSRNGLAVTGDVDADTLSAMVIPIETRMKQMLINLERRRWQNRALGDNHVYINLADSSARVILDGEKKSHFKIAENSEYGSLPTFFGKVVQISRVDVDDHVLNLKIEPDYHNKETTGLGAINVKLQNASEFFESAGWKIPVQGATTVNPDKPLDVFVTYVTAWATKDGAIHYRPDRFNRDAELVELLKLE